MTNELNESELVCGLKNRLMLPEGVVSEQNTWRNHKHDILPLPPQAAPRLSAVLGYLPAKHCVIFFAF